MVLSVGVKAGVLALITVRLVAATSATCPTTTSFVPVCGDSSPPSCMNNAIYSGDFKNDNSVWTFNSGSTQRDYSGRIQFATGGDDGTDPSYVEGSFSQTVDGLCVGSTYDVQANYRQFQVPNDPAVCVLSIEKSDGTKFYCMPVPVWENDYQPWQPFSGSFVAQSALETLTFKVGCEGATSVSMLAVGVHDVSMAVNPACHAPVCADAKIPAPNTAICGSPGMVNSYPSFYRVYDGISSAKECAAICFDYPGCLSFEYTIGYVGQSSPAQCLLLGATLEDSEYIETQAFGTTSYDISCFNQVACPQSSSSTTTSTSTAAAPTATSCPSLALLRVVPAMTVCHARGYSSSSSVTKTYHFGNYDAYSCAALCQATTTCLSYFYSVLTASSQAFCALMDKRVLDTSFGGNVDSTSIYFDMGCFEALPCPNTSTSITTSTESSTSSPSTEIITSSSVTTSTSSSLSTPVSSTDTSTSSTTVKMSTSSSSSQSSKLYESSTTSSQTSISSITSSVFLSSTSSLSTASPSSSSASFSTSSSPKFSSTSLSTSLSVSSLTSSSSSHSQSKSTSLSSSSSIIQTSSSQISSQPTTSPTLFTTSTVTQKNVYTITSCAAIVTNCPIGKVFTEIIGVYTTVCPVIVAPLPVKTLGPEPHLTTSTVYTTYLSTVTACPATVTNCPVGKVLTAVSILYTTLCPLATATVEIDVPGKLIPVSSAPAFSSASKPVTGQDTKTIVLTTQPIITRTVVSVSITSSISSSGKSSTSVAPSLSSSSIVSTKPVASTQTSSSTSSVATPKTPVIVGSGGAVNRSSTWALIAVVVGLNVLL